MNNKSSRTRGGNIAKGERRRGGGAGEEFLRVSKSRGCQKKTARCFAQRAFLTTTLLINTPMCNYPREDNTLPHNS